MTDPAEIRAEGRRLLHVQRASNPFDGAEPYWEFRDFVVDHADVLLADPAPVGLTEDTQRFPDGYPEDPVLGPYEDAPSVDPVKANHVCGLRCGGRYHMDEQYNREWFDSTPSVDPEEGT